MVWHGLLLWVAIACETLATGLLKLSDGMSRLWPTAGMLTGYVASLFLLSVVLKTLPVGPVYAIWSGLGTALTALVGYWAFGDRLTPGAWLGLAFIIAGVVLLAIYLPLPINRYAPHRVRNGDDDECPHPPRPHRCATCRRAGV